MTSRLAVVRLPGLPGELGADDLVYLKPLVDAAISRTDATSRALAGGCPGFGRIEVMIRRRTEIAIAVACVDAVEAWAARLPEAQAERAAAQLGRASARRLPVAGVVLDAPVVMGILNATPDSFSDGGEALASDAAEARGRAMIADGAKLLDIGGESTRPGAEPVSLAEELGRVIPAIERLAGCGVPLSIDSRNAAVMAAALDAGAHLVNDVSALTHDPSSMALVAERGVPVVLMHAFADPRTMQQAPAYDHVSLDVFDYLEARIAACIAAGIARERIIVDPGIGFGKTLEHNLILLRDLPLFHGLGCAILLGASRKSSIGRLSGVAEAGRRRGGSVAAALVGARAGARILRVHDVADTAQALAVWHAIEGMEAR